MKTAESESLGTLKSDMAFSLIELLTAMTILSVLMLLMTSLLSQVQKSWRFGEERISQFREARVAFDLMTKNMSQATINTYWDYEYDDSNNVKEYKKRSELHFYSNHASTVEAALGLSGQTSGHVVFFQAPLGYSVRYRNLSNLFNGRGYLVVHGSDRDFIPEFVETTTNRFRLMEFRPPAEANQVFQDAIEELGEGGSGEQEFTKWWKQSLSGIGEGDFSFYLNPMAQNIILLLVTPMDTLDSQGVGRYSSGSNIAPKYIYDSSDPVVEEVRQQVPPLVKVTMVAIDETTAVQLEDEFGESKPDIIPDNLFQDTKDYNEDIQDLINHFNERNQTERTKINYRVFSTVVMLRSAKWLRSNEPIGK